MDDFAIGIGRPHTADLACMPEQAGAVGLALFLEREVHRIDGFRLFRPEHGPRQRMQQQRLDLVDHRARQIFVLQVGCPLGKLPTERFAHE